ncbi:MAG: pilus assembly protein TadG-related protein [Henriciella sp.]
MRPHDLWALGRDTRGQVAVFLGLSLLPMCAVLGFALDISRQVAADRHLEYATDFASLAGVRAMHDASLNDAAIQLIATNAYHAQLATVHSDVDCEAPTVEIDRTNQSVTVAGGCSFPTMFGARISSLDSMAVSGTATARIDLTELEIALMLDISESMNGAKLDELKTAAKQLVSEIMTASGAAKFALVPYSTAVNASVYGNRAMGRADNDDRFGDGQDIVCVRERQGPEAETDAAPTLGNWVTELLHPVIRCDPPPIVPLTSNRSDLNQAIDALITDEGDTAGNLGVAWSWYALSPNWNGIWPAASQAAAYNNPDIEKVVILMTDGVFGQTFDLSLGVDFSKTNAVALCENMKAEGIRIFSVGFGLELDPVYDTAPEHFQIHFPEYVLRKCATNDDHVFTASTGAELADIYEIIAIRLLGTRLTH